MTDEQKISRAEHMDLMRENAALRNALQSIIDDCEADYPPSHGAIKHFARTALSNAGFDAAVIREGMQ